MGAAEHIRAGSGRWAGVLAGIGRRGAQMIVVLELETAKQWVGTRK